MNIDVPTGIGTKNDVNESFRHRTSMTSSKRELRRAVSCLGKGQSGELDPASYLEILALNCEIFCSHFSFFEDEFRRKTVVQLYGQQVQNTPLVIENDKHALTYIRRVQIVGCEPPSTSSTRIPRKNSTDSSGSLRSTTVVALPGRTNGLTQGLEPWA